MDFLVKDTAEKAVEEIRTTKEIVEQILVDDLEARKNDKWLIIRFMQEVSGFAFPYEKLDNLPAFETITRVRRKLQENGDYQPDEQTLLERKQRDIVFSDYMVNN